MRVGNIHEPQAGVDVTKVPIEGHTQTLSATVTPSHLDASGTWILTEDMKKKKKRRSLQTSQRRTTRMISTDKVAQLRRPRARASMSPPTPNPTTPTANKETTRPSTTIKTPTSTKKAATTNLRKQSRRRARTVGRLHKERAHTKVDDLLAATGITSWILRQSQDLLEAGKVVLQLEPNRINQAKRLPQTRKTGPRDGRTTSTPTYNQTEPNRDNSDLTSDMTASTRISHGTLI